MSRRLAGVVAGTALLASGAIAQAQPGEAEPAPEASLEPASPDADEAPPDALPDAPAISSDAATPAAEDDDEDETRWTDQGLGATAGVAIGGRLTPGGLRLAGAYLYRLSESDWFDGAASFTIGSGDAACFRDRTDERVCDHGAVDGFAVDFVAAIRRTWAPRGQFTPFARLGLGARFLRFADDQVAGLAVPIIGGGGLQVALQPHLRLVASAQVEIGGGLFSRGIGTGSQLGLALGAGVEFALR